MYRLSLRVFSFFFMFVSVFGYAKTDTSGVFRFQLTPAFYDMGYAYAFLGEVGPENYRANITYAWDINSRLRTKVTGEYLSQNHDFAFFPSGKKRWVHQVAVGGAAQFVCCVGFLHSLEISGDFSRAYPKKTSRTEVEGEELRRRTSGSDAYSIQAGTTVSTPCSGLLSGYISYDSVEYTRKFQDNITIEGFGGGFLLDQPVWNSLFTTVKAEFKQPYHFYEAQLNWQSVLCGGCFRLGTFVNYTDGKDKLNNDCKIGVELSYRFGCGYETCDSDFCQDPCRVCSLERWAAIPAVYRPVTLSIVDETPFECIAPAVTGSPPTGLGITLNAVIPPFDFSDFFTGTNLVYSAVNLPPNLVIDETTGVMTGTTVQVGVFQAVIRAENACGVASFPVQITVTDSIN